MDRTRFVPPRTAQAEAVGQDAVKRLMESLPPFTKGNRRGQAIYSTPSGTRITANQEAFCRLVAAGWPIVDAYRYCYAVTLAKAQTIQRRAWDMANNNPATVSRIKELMDARVAGQVHQAEYLRAHVVERLFHESINAKMDGVRVRALELLGKIGAVGLFETPREERQSIGQLEDLREALRSRLLTMLGPGMIDVSPGAPTADNSVSAIGADDVAVDGAPPVVDGSGDPPPADPTPPGDPPCGQESQGPSGPNTADLP